MPFARLRRLTRTLRAQLLLWNAAAVFLTAAAVLIVVREGVHAALLRELDETHQEDLGEIALMWAEATDDATLEDQLNRRAIGHQNQGWFVRFLDADGTPLWSSQHSPAPPARLGELPPGRGTTRGRVRVMRRTLAPPRQGRCSVVVGSNLSMLDEDQARVDRLALLTGLGALLASPLAGYLLARRSTQPFAELIASASKLNPSQTQERLPTRGSGDELDQLAERINSLLERIDDYWRQRQDFLANAAHELRTPLAAIRSSVDVALQSDRSREEYRELMADVVEETESLEIIVNQLLLLSAADAERLGVHAEPFDLRRVAAQATEMFRGVAESQGIELTLTCHEDVVIAGNRHHIRQVVNNLLDNAIKYTHGHQDGRPAKVTVTLYIDQAAQQAVLEFSDEGMGISTEHLPHVFDRFFRADAARSRSGGPTGTGLGLSICQAIVSAHHGTIEPQSQIGVGSRFIVRLPLKQDSAAGHNST